MAARILPGALVAGLLAGFVAALLNLWTLTPLILAAEEFEAPHAHDGVEHTHAEEAAGLSRPLGTVATTLVAYAGFGLLMGAAMLLAARGGTPLDARRGLLWGLAGFAAVHLAPAVGLPPELPGMAAADLGARQSWWALCVAATAGGLWLLAFGPRRSLAALGAALVLLPHLAGAPLPPTHDGAVPPGLAAAFATRALGVAVLAWALLGVLAGAWAARPAPSR